MNFFKDEIADRHEEVLRKMIQEGAIKDYKAPGRRITKHKAIATCLYNVHMTTLKIYYGHQ